MKKSILSLIVFLFAAINHLHAQALTPEMDEFLNKIDGASLADIEAELDAGLEGLKAFAEMFNVDDTIGMVDYANSGKEEQYDNPFKIDTTAVAKAMRQFTNMGFQQSFKNDKSQIKFQKIGDDYWNTVWMEEGMTEAFTPKAIHYKNGDKITEGISEYRTSFFFENPWGKIGVIDSIDVDYTINYTAAYDSLVLTQKSKKVKYKDGLIKVKKLDRNFLYFTISDAYADGVYVNAINAAGKVLNSNSSSWSPTSDATAGDGIFKIIDLLEEVRAKLKNKDFKDTDAFKKFVIKKASKIEEVKDTDGVHHRKFYFEGNIETVQLFIETKGISKTVTFRAKNNSGFGDILLMQNKTHNIFMDADGKELFKLAYSPIRSLGSRYFQNDSLYYHLNLKTEKLDKIKAVHIWEAPNQMSFIKVDDSTMHRMYDAEHKLVSEMVFEDLFKIDATYVHGISNGQNYMIDSKGNIKKLDGITRLRDPFDQRIAALMNEKYGFLDNSGEIAIPFEYIDVENFKDGYAIVAKENDKYGLIDVHGKTVLPLEYPDILSHESGFVWVSTIDGYQLIDPTGKTLVTVEGNSYSKVTSGGETTYQFGDKKYDAFGNLVSEDKTEN